MRVGKRIVVVSMLFGIAITAWSRSCLLPDAGAAPPQDAPGKYQGAMTCDGASCHGKKEARAEPPYLTEYVSFTGRSPEGAAYDRHSIAFKRLKDKGQDSDEHSKAIMEKLNALEGTKDAATTSERCLTCHGVSVHDYGMGKGGLAVGRVKELQGKGYKAEDGVSCDGCHGPAEKWVDPHQAKDWTIKTWKDKGGREGGSLKLYNDYGIYYSKDLTLWANQCIRCHLAIDTNLIDAGHPDLVPFELFGHNSQVPHWRDYSAAPADATWLPAPGPFHAATVWQTGQTVALESALRQIADRAKGLNHNKASAAATRNAFDRAWGHWVVLRHAAKRQAAEAAKGLEADFAALKALVPATGDVDLAKVAAAAEKLAAAVKPLATPMAQAKLDLAALKALMADVVGDAAVVETGRAAEQAAKALYALNYSYLYATKPDALNENPPTDLVMKAVYELFENMDPASATYKPALGRAKDAIGKR